MAKPVHTKRILVCPLNWGLGHASRDVPIVQHLLDSGHIVILAGDGLPLQLLTREFPELETFEFRSSVRIRYSLHLPAWLKITLLSPLLLFEILTEHFRLKSIVRDIKPDVIISDNRYGLWHRKVLSILVTHQTSIRLPRFARFLEYPAYLVTRSFISRFDRCWIPDYPGMKNLSGDLSHRYRLPGNAVFVGAISRFDRPASKNPPPLDDPISIVILLSGPEPQRSRLQKIVLKQIFSLDKHCIILQGQPGKHIRKDLTHTVSMYSHIPAGELNLLLRKAEFIICRAGYTGIMDLATLNKKALIIPTPGQTEQEYLARYLSSTGMFMTCRQEDLDIESYYMQAAGFHPDFNLPAGDFLGGEINKI